MLVNGAEDILCEGGNLGTLGSSVGGHKYGRLVWRVSEVTDVKQIGFFAFKKIYISQEKKSPAFRNSIGEFQGAKSMSIHENPDYDWISH
jgi:hypothetical protein